MALHSLRWVVRLLLGLCAPKLSGCDGLPCLKVQARSSAEVAHLLVRDGGNSGSFSLMLARKALGSSMGSWAGGQSVMPEAQTHTKQAKLGTARLGG